MGKSWSLRSESEFNPGTHGPVHQHQLRWRTSAASAEDIRGLSSLMGEANSVNETTSTNDTKSQIARGLR